MAWSGLEDLGGDHGHPLSLLGPVVLPETVAATDLDLWRHHPLAVDGIATF